MIITRCYDVDIVRSILTHPDIYDRISEDGAPSAESYQPNMDSATFLVGVVDAMPIGVFIVHQINGVTWECHLQVLPEHRKNHASEFLTRCIDLVSNAGVKKIVAQIPYLYPNVKDFALRHGFHIEGVNRKSYLKHGQLYDQWYVGLVR